MHVYLSVILILLVRQVTTTTTKRSLIELEMLVISI